MSAPASVLIARVSPRAAAPPVPISRWRRATVRGADDRSGRCAAASRSDSITGLIGAVPGVGKPRPADWYEWTSEIGCFAPLRVPMLVDRGSGTDGGVRRRVDAASTTDPDPGSSGTGVDDDVTPQGWVSRHGGGPVRWVPLWPSGQEGTRSRTCAAAATGNPCDVVRAGEGRCGRENARPGSGSGRCGSHTTSHRTVLNPTDSPTPDCPTPDTTTAPHRTPRRPHPDRPTP